MEKRYLLLNADDFGLCRSANAAVIDLFQNGFLRSATVMTPCPGAEEAARFAAEHPEYAIGVHLTTTNEWGERWPWGALTHASSLETPEGRMWRDSPEFEAHARRGEIVRELRAQVERAREFGMKPSHLDNHMGSLYGLHGRRTLLLLVFRLCGRERLPFRMCVRAAREYAPCEVPYSLYRLFCGITRTLSRLYRVPTPDYLILSDQLAVLDRAESYERFRQAFLEVLGGIPAGITETFVHPALDTEEMRAITGAWRRRYWEYLFLRDPEVKAFLDRAGIALIDYRELVRLKTNK